MATAAANQQQTASVSKPKILRIGIIQGGRIVEERLVRKRENITIGQSAKNMFVVPSDALPRNWLLFQVSGNQYVAHFSEGMDARIAKLESLLAASNRSGKRQAAPLLQRFSQARSQDARPQSWPEPTPCGA